MQQFFFGIHQFILRRKGLSFSLIIALFLFFLFFASKISFSEDITRLIPTNDASNVTAKVLNQMNFSDKISIVISAEGDGETDDLADYANVFLDTINETSKPFIGKIQGKIDEKNIQATFDFVYNNLPLFLDKKDYQTIGNKIQNDSVAQALENDYKSLISPTGMVTKDFILKDPLGISFIALKKLQQLSVGDDFELQDGFIFTKDKKNLLLFITPKLATNETDKNTVFIGQLKSVKDHLNSTFKGKAQMSYFGATPVAVDNATQIKADVQNTSIFAAVTLILILVFFYRSLLTPIIIFIPSLFGAFFALGILYFTRGTISAISLGISSILLGETTDYSIYVLTHLRNNKSAKLLYKDITKPLLLCGITTAVSFLCLFFVKSEALKDLGLFAALSVVSTSVFSLVLIPLLYKTKNDLIVPKPNIIDKLGAYSYHKNKYLLVGVLGFLIACLFTYSKVSFNNDLSSLNYMSQDLKKTEEKLEKIADISSKSIYLATYGDDQETVVANNKVLFDALLKEKEASRVLNFSSIGGVVFSKEQQLEKIKEWNKFWDVSKKTLVKNRIIASGNTFGFKENSFSVFYEMLNKDFNLVSIKDYESVKSLFLDEFMGNKNGFYTISTLVKVPLDKRDEFVNAIKKQPNLIVIDRQQTNETFLGNLKKNFESLVNYSFIAIFIILFLSFKRIELVIVSIIPILASWLITTGMMGMFGLQFNIINIIVCTLIFGIGVDYSIFMTSALQKEYTYGKKVLATYKASILLSVATTILGIGVLVFAKHPALKSISIISIIGIFSALVITFTLQPLVFNFLITDRVKKGKAPFEIRRLIHSIISFTYYLAGGFVLSIVSVTLMKIIPLKRSAKLKGFHYVMSKFMYSVFLTYPAVKRKESNEFHETFDKPAVIIANHMSFLDILAIGKLSPKIIFLVSDWVYNSPAIGLGVKLAGFYPVSNGIDNGVEHLREKVNQGYSLMVFPEGTRSEDNLIKRFHKGAFYLAEQFKLDIVPVLIHGYSEAAPKGDFILNGASTTVKILGRIKVDDASFGVDYAERTKKIGAFFKTQYAALRQQSEGQDYFKKQIINSFDYKELKVVQKVKADFNLNSEVYFQINSYIGSKEKVLHIGNDYGLLDLSLVLQEPLRKVDSLLLDEDNRAVAKTNYIVKKRTINYLESSDTIKDKVYDTVVLSAYNTTVDLEYVANCAKQIIVIDNQNLKEVIVSLGLVIALETNRLIVLKK
ncbi:MMPL family transporter [Flavobacterium muglaense]|uniref:MMPL family transporter n=1 Tax=Flavobacterium muglaense TaxID=2764716 RepID=A0A923MYS4_9FLAO|nr:MMPL family transporter [Flavobacterium muglaense]MBC5837336.1 MMPL family transporter [Flavobacterium muglaense]MBC5843932.1 MMPL family transporter [Flavobacterium muglaense]